MLFSKVGISNFVILKSRITVDSLAKTSANKHNININITLELAYIKVSLIAKAFFSSENGWQHLQHVTPPSSSPSQVEDDMFG